MTVRLRIQPGARNDLRNAFRWYETGRQGLGLELLDEVRACVLRIQDHPLAARAIGGGARQALVRRFPYRVVYLVEGTQVEVLAIWHVRRDPDGWHERRG